MTTHTEGLPAGWALSNEVDGQDAYLYQLTKDGIWIADVQEWSDNFSEENDKDWQAVEYADPALAETVDRVLDGFRAYDEQQAKVQSEAMLAADEAERDRRAQAALAAVFGQGK